MRQRVTVCPHTGPNGSCPNLVSKDEPCPTHGRPKNASWSPDRDRKAHWKLRMAVIKARGAQCERCRKPAEDGRGKGLQMHHIRPGNTPADVILTCRDCHKEIDTHAR